MTLRACPPQHPALASLTHGLTRLDCPGPREEAETVALLTSLPPHQLNAAQWLADNRAAWGIENGLHWVLDMVFDEDRNRTRKDHGPENLTWLRKLAISVLRNAKNCKGSIRSKQLQAILDDKVLESIMSIFAVN